MATGSKQRASLLAAGIVGAVLTGAAMMPVWIGYARLKVDLEKLSAEKRTAEDELATAQADMHRLEALLLPFRTLAEERHQGTESEVLRQLAEQIARAQTGDVPESSRTSADNAAPAQKPQPKPKPKPEPNTVALGDVNLAAMETGINARMQFRPARNEPLGPLVLVVRLPKDSQARILDLAPAGSTAYTLTGKRISDDGRFAVFQGTPRDLTDLSFDLAVTQPVIATVRGNCGLEAFELEFR